MSRFKYKDGRKTMRNVKVVSFEFVKDESGNSPERTEEVRNLIAQMIELSHKRGRPRKDDEEVEHAA